MNKILITSAVILVVLLGFFAFQFSKSGWFKFGSPIKELTIKDQKFTVEIASSSAEQELGLSGRNKLDKNRGMFFVFEKSDYHAFWMKGMKFPIDIVFIENDKVVSTIENAQPPLPDATAFPIMQPSAPANRAVEIRAGLVKEYGIKKGDTVKIAL